MHWGFAAFGGLCALLFLARTHAGEAFVPLLALPPQLCWLGFVAHRARQAGIARSGMTRLLGRSEEPG